MALALLSMRRCCVLLLICLTLLPRHSIASSSSAAAAATVVISRRAASSSFSWNDEQRKLTTTTIRRTGCTSKIINLERNKKDAIFPSSSSSLSISLLQDSASVGSLSLRGGGRTGTESQQSLRSKVSKKKHKATRKRRSIHTHKKKVSVKAAKPPPLPENEKEEDEESNDEDVDSDDENDEEEQEKEQDEKKKISKVLREKDAAQAMGDAIRDRASQFRESSSSSSSSSSLLDSIDGSVSSVGWAMGASDRRSLQFVSSFIAMQQQKDQKTKKKQYDMEDDNDEDESGGVETATTSVLVHYFLKSHGGAHALQCVCSLLATMAGWTVITLGLFQGQSTSSSNNNSNKLAVLSLTLMRRCMIFAMMKHVSGLLAASFLTARAIPQVGLSQARLWMNDLVRDPVSQYVFYAACILLWLPNNSRSDLGTRAWWQAYSSVPALLVGPIVLRETISTMLVISDVLVLWTCSAATSHTSRSSREDEDADDSSVEDFDDDAASIRSPTLVLVQAFLRVSTSIVNAIMSILVTPKVWRSTTNNVQERQAILAKLTSRASLVMEVLVGILLVVDAVKSLVAFIFGATSSSTATAQPSSSSSSTVFSFGSILRRVICTRLYLHYLWLRRRKIERLAIRMRGGASSFPFYVLDVLMDPIAAMGYSPRVANQDARQKETGRRQQPQRSRREVRGNNGNKDTRDHDHFTWKEYLTMALSEST